MRKYMLNSLVTDEIEATWICLRTGASWGQMLVPGARGAICALCILCGSKYRPPTHNESVEPKFENASETTSEQRYFELDFFCKKQCHNGWRIKVGVRSKAGVFLLCLLSGFQGTRQALFDTERGVCQNCELDCHGSPQTHL